VKSGASADEAVRLAKERSLSEWSLITRVSLMDASELGEGGLFPHVRASGGRLRVNSLDRLVHVVRAGAFARALETAVEALKGGGIVVVAGPRGTGRSTLAAAIAWELLAGGAVKTVALASSNSAVAAFLRRYGEFADIIGGVLMICDLRPRELPALRVREVVMDIARGRDGGGPPVLLLLSDRAYSAAGESIKELPGAREITAYYDAELLRELISVHADGCADRVGREGLDAIARELMRLNEGHAVTAALLGSVLSAAGCDAGAALELLRVSGYDAVKLAARALNIVAPSGPLCKAAALRRPFARWTPAGRPIVPPGVLELLGGAPALLAYRQHDIIEEALEASLAECGAQPVPESEQEAVDMFVREFGGALSGRLRELAAACLEDVASALGCAIAGCEEPQDGGGARCEALRYIKAGGAVPPLTAALAARGAGRASPLVQSLAEHHGEALRAARELAPGPPQRREGALVGLAAIAAGAAGARVRVGAEDAGLLLRLAVRAVDSGVVKPRRAWLVLSALEPLADIAPQYYLALLHATSALALDRLAAKLVYALTGYVYGSHEEELARLEWPLLLAAETYARLLGAYAALLSAEEREGAVLQICAILERLRAAGDELSALGRALVLAPLLRSPYASALVELKCGIDVVQETAGAIRTLEGAAWDGASVGAAAELAGLASRGAREVVVDAMARAAHALAIRLLELARPLEASEAFNKAALAYRELGDRAGYLISRSMSIRARVMAAEDMADYADAAGGLEDLLLEAVSAGERSAQYAEALSALASEYAVYLASIGALDRLERAMRKLRGALLQPALTKLMLRAMGAPVEVGPDELLHDVDVDVRYAPALAAALGVKDRDGALSDCGSLADESRYNLCVNAILALGGDQQALDALWGMLSDEVAERIALTEGAELVHLLAPGSSSAQLALSLHALLSGRAELARAHLLRGSEEFSGLLGELFRGALASCCDPGREEFRLALLKLFYYHV
jgi:hypothetical protein